MTETNEPLYRWKYRSVTCELYGVEGVGFIGYATLGDERIRLLDGELIDTEDAQQKVEDEVDELIEGAIEAYESDEGWNPLSDPFDDPLDYDPGPAPLPNPNPNPFPQPDPQPKYPPYDPIWIGDTFMNSSFLSDSSTTTDGSSIEWWKD